MKSRYPHVYDPFEIRGVWFKNRLQQAPPGCFSQGMKGVSLQIFL